MTKAQKKAAKVAQQAEQRIARNRELLAELQAHEPKAVALALIQVRTNTGVAGDWRASDMEELTACVGDSALEFRLVTGSGEEPKLRCENCDAPATHSDSEGVPLCDACKDLPGGESEDDDRDSDPRALFTPCVRAWLNEQAQIAERNVRLGPDGQGWLYNETKRQEAEELHAFMQMAVNSLPPVE